MSNVLKIDPDVVEATASALKTVAEEAHSAGTAIVELTSNDLQPIDPGHYAFRQGLAVATAFWARRISGLAVRITDGAEFMETNAAMARAADADAEADFVELENAVSANEYTKQDYYAATGTTPPADTTVGDESAMPVNGESVVV